MMQTLKTSIIVPCYNEVKNIKPLIEALEKTLKNQEWEVIFVDDNSPDGTNDIVQEISKKNHHVRGICRLHEKGLSSAVITGMNASSSPLIAVMDGDLQHDEKTLIPMIKALSNGCCDMAVASRYKGEGTNEGLSNGWRQFLSRFGIWMVQHLMGIPLTDPLSGCFALKRDVFNHAKNKLGGKGFKILLDLIMASPNSLKIEEFPMVFRKRLHGESKLGKEVMISFALMILKGTFKRHFIIITSFIIINFLLILTFYRKKSF